jgi:hypothetical protein
MPIIITHHHTQPWPLFVADCMVLFAPEPPARSPSLVTNIFILAGMTMSKQARYQYFVHDVHSSLFQKMIAPDPTHRSIEDPDLISTSSTATSQCSHRLGDVAGWTARLVTTAI